MYKPKKNQEKKSFSNISKKKYFINNNNEIKQYKELYIRQKYIINLPKFP